MHPNQQQHSRKWRATPRGQYSVHKHNAAVRGVGFDLTYEQWWSIWALSGRWSKRGNRHGLYVMCRRSDEGPYTLDNVYIDLFNRNLSDARAKSLRVRRKHTRKTTTVRYDADVDGKVKTTYGAEEAPF